MQDPFFPFAAILRGRAEFKYRAAAHSLGSRAGHATYARRAEDVAAAVENQAAVWVLRRRHSAFHAAIPEKLCSTFSVHLPPFCFGGLSLNTVPQVPP